MRLIAGVLCVSVSLLCAAEASDGIPSAYDLDQNDPNPFCADSLREWTEIRFEVPAPAHVRVVVGSSDGIIVMRTLINQELDAGYYVLYWDGRDDWGGYMPSERYPYSLQEKDPDTGRWSLISRLVVTIDCTTGAEPATWGRIKALYRVQEWPTANSYEASYRQ